MKRLLWGIVLFVGVFTLTSMSLTSDMIHISFPTKVLQADTKKEPEKVQQEASLLFVGDMMFDRYIRTVIARSGETTVLSEVRSLLIDADITAGNLEGPITGNASVSQGTAVGDTSNMRFTFSPSVADMLHAYGFDLVSIGNNHIQDFGSEGAIATTQFLSGAGLSYIGDPTGRSAEPVIKEVDGIKLAFVSYSDFVGGDAERARAAIQQASRDGADATIVMSHWGSEYEVEPGERVRELAHGFVALGADLIIGTHSHIIGATEDINGARVYYSLGNFVFDQYWEPNVRCGLAVKATFTKEEGRTRISFEETRIGMERTGRTVLGCS